MMFRAAQSLLTQCNGRTTHTLNDKQTGQQANTGDLQILQDNIETTQSIETGENYETVCALNKRMDYKQTGQ